MKKKSVILLLLFIISCEKIKIVNETTENKDSLTANTNIFSKIAEDKQKKYESQKIKNLNSKHYTTLDTVVIRNENDFLLKLSRQDFNKIIDNHPEFFDEIIQSPDITYRNFGSDFSSEAGQDQYYNLYAYFLAQKNGIEKNARHRKKLIRIYSAINSIFGYLANGGTFFGHQQSRLVADAEYAVYLHSESDNSQSKDEYDVSKQKKLYIQSLRQRIDDEVKIDKESTAKEKIERIQELNGFVNEIDLLITNLFYLRCAQHFQYNYY